MSEAMQHYKHEAHRWPSRRVIARHRLTVYRERVFRWAAGHVLPEEMLQNVIDLCRYRKPTKEDFDSSRAQENLVFLYLDAKTFNSGPQIIISDPKVSTSKTMTPEMKCLQQNKAPWTSLRGEGGVDTALEVSHWRSWATVAERLHTLWSIRSSRNHDIEDEDLPCLIMDIQIPAICSPEPFHWRHRANRRIPPGAHITLRLHGSTQPVTVHRPILPESFLFEYLTVTDVETGHELDLTRLSKVEGMEPATAFTLDEKAGWSCAETLQTFNVGQSIDVKIRIQLLLEWRYNLLAGNELIDGRSYRVGVKRGLKIQRWTFGTGVDLKGPYNLPPVRVEPGRDSTFTYRRV